MQNLKITGEINSDDFYFMRDSMDRLQALNMKEVKIKGVQGEEDVIPQEAMKGKTSLFKLVLPDKLVGIRKSAFNECSNLSGSLVIPEGTRFIENAAFEECRAFTGTLSLPSTLERLGSPYEGGSTGVFRYCGFVGELRLPENLKYIGIQAFYACAGLYGELHLPNGLSYVGTNAFDGCKNLTGSLKIPQTLTEISVAAFARCGFNGVLTLHDGITAIGKEAFEDSPFKGELVLPKDLTVIGDRVFSGCDFSGELKLPDKLVTIGDNAFAYNWRLMGVLRIPENVQSIGAGAFAECRSLEGLIFPANLESIRYEATWGDVGGAFSNCYGISSIVCEGTIPPYVQVGAFNGVAKDNFTVEVPEAYVDQYKAAPGWSDGWF